MVIGIVAAWKRGSRLDVVSLGFTLVAYSMPTFWSVSFLWPSSPAFSISSPVSGMVSPSLVFAGSLAKMATSSTTYSCRRSRSPWSSSGEYAIVMRNSMIGVADRGLSSSPRARRGSPRGTSSPHALPNAMIPHGDHHPR